MPELPEVHTVVTQLRRELRGRTIIRLAEWNTRKMLQPTPDILARIVRGARVRGVRRRAKLILIDLEDGAAVLAVHLKLNGRLLVQKSHKPRDPYTRAVFTLDDGNELRFADSRKFGYIRVFNNARELNAVIDKYGPEPLDASFTAARLADLLKHRATKIKPLLMDQSVISGIGNIYSDEALFAAKINPRRSAKSLSQIEVRRLHRAIQNTLRAGITHHGTSDQWFVDTHGRKGSHQNYLRVYGRSGEPCPRCRTPIQRLKLGGRSAHFCPKCQR